MIRDPFLCKIDQLYNPSYASLTYHIIYWGLCGKIMNYSAMQQQRMTIENTFANKEKSFFALFCQVENEINTFVKMGNFYLAKLYIVFKLRSCLCKKW